MDTNQLPTSHTFRSLYKYLNKPKHIFNFKKFEVYFSIICSLILAGINYEFVTTNIDSNMPYIIATIQNMILYTIAGLLTILGFVVSGLAILSGTIGYKMTHQIIIDENIKILYSILFSFYYIGFVIGILIVSCIFCYFIMGINLPFNMLVFQLASFILAYGLFFTIFYAVSLLGTCINMFGLNFIYSLPSETSNGEDKDA